MKMKYRTYKRVYFANPIKAQISITKVQGYPVQTKSSAVHIHNFSNGGLSFSSQLNFPLDEMELMFHVHIFGKSMCLKGTASWQRKGPNGLYYYGVRLTKLNIQFYQILDQLSPQKKILA